MVLPLGDLEKTSIVPFATYALIALNVVMFLCQLEHGRAFTASYAATPYEITHDVDLPLSDDESLDLDLPPQLRRQLLDQEHVPFPVWMTLFTAMFLHGSPLHLAGNMLYLWIFGDNVEEVLGTWWYLLLYLSCGVMGTLLQIAAGPDSVIPTLGASGAIAGVMGAYLVWFPHNQIRVLVFRFITQMPALLVIGAWILLQVGEGVGSLSHVSEMGGVAYLAHLGGAATGILVAFLFADRARRVQALHDAQDGWFVGP
jgi:membrane associated rhomboid family serine protease